MALNAVLTSELSVKRPNASRKLCAHCLETQLAVPSRDAVRRYDVDRVGRSGCLKARDQQLEIATCSRHAPHRKGDPDEDYAAWVPGDNPIDTPDGRSPSSTKSRSSRGCASVLGDRGEDGEGEQATDPGEGLPHVGGGGSAQA